MNDNPLKSINKHFKPLSSKITEHLIFNIRRIRWGQKEENKQKCKQKYLELIYATTYHQWIIQHNQLMSQAQIEYLGCFGETWIIRSLFVLKDFINREFEEQWEKAGERPKWLNACKTKSQN